MKSFPVGRVLSCAALLFAAACGTTDIERYDPAIRFPMKVERKIAHLEIAAPSQDGISPDDQANIYSFLQAFADQGEAPIDVTVESGSVADLGARKKAQIVAGWLQSAGVPPESIRLYVSSGGSGGRVSLAFPIYVAQLPECGHWDYSAEKDPYNTNTDNFGCSVQRNIAAMAVDPRDLYRSRAATPRYGSRSWDIVTNYEKGDPIPGANDLQAPLNSAPFSPIGGGGS